MNRVFSALLVIAITIVLGSLQLAAQDGSSFHRAQVKVRRANIYTSPTTDQSICDELPVGTVVHLYMATSDGYVAIRPTPRCFSWVESRFLLIDRDGVKGTVTGPDARQSGQPRRARPREDEAGVGAASCPVVLDRALTSTHRRLDRPSFRRKRINCM